MKKYTAEKFDTTLVNCNEVIGLKFSKGKLYVSFFDHEGNATANCSLTVEPCSAIVQTGDTIAYMSDKAIKTITKLGVSESHGLIVEPGPVIIINEDREPIFGFKPSAKTA